MRRANREGLRLDRRTPEGRAKKREQQRRWEAENRDRQAWSKATQRFGEAVDFDVWTAVWHGPCFACGVTPARGVDHVVPKVQGGRNVASNLQPSCLTCNLSKAGTEGGRHGRSLTYATAG